MKSISGALVTMALISGCAAGHQEPTGDAYGPHAVRSLTLTEETLTLCKQRPKDPGFAFELLRVEGDGTVVILCEGEEYRAMPGERPFRGGSTMRVRTSDPSEQRAEFTYLRCETS
jgi:hypothetical protein